MATTTAGASHGLTKRNDGGVVLEGGDIASGGPITVAPGYTTTSFRSGVHGAHPVVSTGGMVKAKSTYTFAYKQVATQFIGHRYAGYINGTANTLLETGSSDTSQHRSINRLNTTRRYNITAWSYVTGAATKGGNAGDEVDFGSDHAATPSRAIPGEFVYMEGKGNDVGATQDDYDAKTD